MRYTLQQLKCDVMELLGENARQHLTLPELCIPSAPERLAARIAALLPVCGSKVIAEADSLRLGGAETISPPQSRVLMPCGLYATDLVLPPDTLRILEIFIQGWSHPASDFITRESGERSRQWSREAAIAGCPESPRVYLHSSPSGPVARCMANVADTDTVVRLSLWKIPNADDNGDFNFPQGVYADLLECIRARSLFMAFDS